MFYNSGARRKVFSFCGRAYTSKTAPKISEKKPNVVILGSGWGSYSVLKNLNRKAFNVTVVTPRNHFLFTPLLCSTTVGTLEFRSIIEPIRNIGFDDPSSLMLSYAESLDTEKKLLHCRSVLDSSQVFQLNYDILIIGVGCLNNTFGVPGVEKYAFFLKEIIHAQKIRNRILQNCETALQLPLEQDEKKRLLHTVIVGGGPTGVEFGAELYDFKVQDVRKLYKQDEEKLFHVTLIESSNILSGFDKKLRTYAEKKLNERANFELLKSTVVEVKEKCVILKDGTVIPCGLVVWSTGLSPQPFTKSLPFPKNEKGQILTDGYLRVLGDKNGSVFALGDCAEIQSEPLPCTAQVAERQGRYIAKVLNSGNLTDQSKFNFKSSGMLAYIGNYDALTDLPDFKGQGFTSWFLWRSAYLTRLGSWRLRMQVPMDWLKTLCFGRDISRF